MIYVRANGNYFKERYNGLKPLPQLAEEETWVDRLRAWEDFEKGGVMTAGLLESLFRFPGLYLT